LSSDLIIRPFASHADYLACANLQHATWGQGFRELVPPAMLKITQKVGGIAAGAFHGDTLIGFVYGVTGWKNGRPVHWSHMLAVDEAHRDQGIGRQLKQHQREQLLAAGVEHMYWTFDPLVARNAHINLNRLGARITEYVVGMYGDDPESTMDSIIGTDRFVVEWDLTSALPASGGATAGAHAEQAPAVSLEHSELPDAPSVRIMIPDDVQELKQRAPDAARAWRALTREAFQHYLEAGYVVRGVGRDAANALCWYVVQRD